MSAQNPSLYVQYLICNAAAVCLLRLPIVYAQMTAAVQDFVCIAAGLNFRTKLIIIAIVPIAVVLLLAMPVAIILVCLPCRSEGHDVFPCMHMAVRC